MSRAGRDARSCKIQESRHGWERTSDPRLKSDVATPDATAQSSMEHDLRMGLSFWAIAAIVCNSVVGVLILVLFVILYKACKVPSHQDKVPAFHPEAGSEEG
ncbi:hypothetical protein FQA47_020902 [Oryzias melastigma]|uniref:Uncharacterized protein n=1 Tax=Oryzias melastigma TaxID=30732 RepID=A0A834FCN6_ORYME|nr:hypothetical protein FQA47_020902 [Oryzias melastigma]